MPCPTPGDGEKTQRSSWTLLLPNGIAPRDGVGKAQFYSISSFTSFIPSNPGTGRVLVPVSHFGPRAAPKP